MPKISTYTITNDALTDLILGDTNAPTTVRFLKDQMLAFMAPSLTNYRLTVQTNVAVPATDQAAQSTLYATPYNGNRLCVFDGTRWRLVAPGQISLALSGLTTGKNYDAFVDWNAGTPAVVLGPAWTNDTTRATALTTQDGVSVLTGTLTSRYLGTIRASGATTTEDTAIQRFVWNASNPVPRVLFKGDGTAHTYASGTARQWNATAADMVEFVIGQAAAPVSFAISGDMSPDVTSGFTQTGAGVDSTTAINASSVYSKITGGSVVRLLFAASDNVLLGTGYHFIAMLEAELAGVTSTFNQAFLRGTILG